MNPMSTRQELKDKIDKLEKDLERYQKLETRLREEISFREAVVLRAAEGICVCHEVEVFPYVCFNVWNDRMVEITGYKLDEINSKGWYQSLYPDDDIQARAVARMAEMREGRDLLSEEWEITAKDGCKRSVSISTSLLETGDGTSHVLAVINDVTLRKDAKKALQGAYDQLELQVRDRTNDLLASNESLKYEIESRNKTEESLKRSEARYRSLIEQSPMGISIFRPDGSLVFANDAMRRLHGLSHEDHKVVSARYNILHDRQLAEKGILSLIEKAFAGQPMALPLTAYDLDRIASNENRNPQRIWLESVIYPVKNDANQVEDVILTHKDITELKHYEKELQDSLAKMNALVKASPIAISLLDVHGKVTLWNPAAERLFGWSAREALGRINPVVPQGKMTEFKKNLDYVLQGNVITEIEIQRERKDGSTIEISLSAAPVCNAAEEIFGIAVMMSDISDRKKAEESLRESEERFRQIASNIKEVFWLFDWQEQRVLYVSPAFDMIWGRSRESLYERYDEWSESIHPDDVTHAEETFNIILETGGGEPREYRIVRPDGSQRWISDTGYAIKDAEGNIVRITGIAEDITERKRSEAALNSEKERLAVTLHSIGDAVIATDRSEFITLMNPIAENLTGWPEAEAKGRLLSEVFHIVNDTTGQPSLNPVQQVLETGIIQDLTNDTVLINRDGKKYNIADSAAPIKDTGQKIVGVVLVFRDITAAQRTEAELLKMEKLKSLGILAGGIAHDFNNFLTGIIGNLSLVQMDIDPNNRIFPRLNEMEKAAMRAKDLTQQLLTFSKGGEPIKRLTQIDVLVREAALFAVRGSSVRCRFDFPDNLWPANVDTGQIGQVIHNLVINAEQVMPEGGIITISGNNATVVPDIHIKLTREQYIRIMIQDQGTGIKKEHMGRIFDPYFTTKQKGSGLGLTIVHSIIEKHDGHVEVDSELGTGSMFSIYLPASPGSAVKTPERSERITSGSGCILVMDDEEFIRTLISEMLNKLGYDTVLARDGAEAIRIFRHAMESDRPFDAVILDLTIPGGMGGQETVVRLAEIDEHVKAIVSSGYSNDPVMSNYTDFGFASAVRKPYMIKELSDTLIKLNLL